MTQQPKRKPTLADDRMCFGCGSRNERGLKLRFKLDRARKTLRTRWTPSKEHQGYADIVHGGMIGVVLDEVMGNLLWLQGMPAVTAEMSVRFLRPAKVGCPIECEAKIRSKKGRVFQMEASAQDAQGRVVAEAAARFVHVGKSKRRSFG